MIDEAFLKAAGEIRGRIHQAVEMASEPLESRSREIQAEIAAVARQQSEELQKQLETARQRLQSTYEESQSVAESALQKLATETLDSLRQDAQQLAQSSIDRWQSALTETLAAIPQILAAKLSCGNCTAERRLDEVCVALNHSGVEDGGTQGR
jgi:DNA anti-recombination protein RmuC